MPSVGTEWWTLAPACWHSTIRHNASWSGDGVLQPTCWKTTSRSSRRGARGGQHSNVHMSSSKPPSSLLPPPRHMSAHSLVLHLNTALGIQRPWASVRSCVPVAPVASVGSTQSIARDVKSLWTAQAVYWRQCSYVSRGWSLCRSATPQRGNQPNSFVPSRGRRTAWESPTVHSARKRLEQEAAALAKLESAHQLQHMRHVLGTRSRNKVPCAANVGEDGIGNIQGSWSIPRKLRRTARYLDYAQGTCTRVSRDRKSQPLRVHQQPPPGHTPQSQQPSNLSRALGVAAKHLVSGASGSDAGDYIHGLGGQPNLVSSVAATPMAGPRAHGPACPQLGNHRQQYQQQTWLILDIPNAQPTPTLSQLAPPGKARFFASSPAVAMPVELWTDPEFSNVRDGGDEDIASALGDEELEKVLEGIASGHDLGQVEGIKRHALGGYEARDEEEAKDRTVQAPAQHSRPRKNSGLAGPSTSLNGVPSRNGSQEHSMQISYWLKKLTYPTMPWLQRSSGSSRKAGERAS